MSSVENICLPADSVNDRMALRATKGDGNSPPDAQRIPMGYDGAFDRAFWIGRRASRQEEFSTARFAAHYRSNNALRASPFTRLPAPLNPRRSSGPVPDEATP